MFSLPVLNSEPQRPEFAQGPRSLSYVKLLRISVTDRCNLRCVYCMPNAGVEWMAKQKDLLTAHDIETVARAAVSMGIKHLKITGGEPTIRHDIIEIAQRLGAIEGVEDLSLTTNGLLLERLSKPLRDAGIERLTLSCDSLRPDRYREITQGADLEQFWRGVRAAEDADFRKIKINVVVIKGINDDEVADMAALATDRPWTIRFIEYMPLGDSALAVADPEDAIVDNAQVKRAIETVHGPLDPMDRSAEAGVGPAQVFQLRHGQGRIGFISAMSKPFCETCNRLRLTAVGELRSCLFDGGEVNVLSALRPRPDFEAIRSRFEECVILKPTTHSGHGNRAMSQIGG